MKNLLKQITPQLAINLYRKLFIPKKEIHSENLHYGSVWSGHYSSWQEAQNNTKGYDDRAILEKCKDSLLKVKNGEANYERDSVLFDKIQYSWPVLASLQRSAIENNNKLSVLDFGGSFGSTYFQNKDFITKKVDLRWHIVEQKNFVEEGKKFFEDDRLLFHETIEKLLESEKPNCLLLSSVLPYLPDPFAWIKKFIQFGFEFIIIDRTSFINGDDRLTIQKVPESIYLSSYPCWFFNKEKFLTYFANKYDLIAEFDDSFTSEQTVDGEKGYWKGFYFKLKNGG